MNTDFITTLTFIDGRLTNTTQLFFLIIGLWGTWRAIRGESVDGNYYGTLAIGEVLYIVLLVLDVLLLIVGHAPTQRAWLHYLYAVFAVLLIPFVHTTTLKGDDSNRAQWVYAFVTLFLAGIAVRADITLA